MRATATIPLLAVTLAGVVGACKNRQQVNGSLATQPCPTAQVLGTTCQASIVPGSDSLIVVRCTTTVAVGNDTTESAGEDTVTNPDPKK